MRHFIWVCKHLKNEYVKNTISIYSSNVVFFIMLSFFPFALFFMTLLKYTPITQDYLFSLIQVIIPGQIGDTLVPGYKKLISIPPGPFYPSLLS